MKRAPICTTSAARSRWQNWPTIPLLDPTLTLYDGQGTQIDFSDNWQSNPAAAEIEATTLAPSDLRESAVLQTLAPGAYTAIVRGAASTTGTGLVEVYALPPQ